MSYDWYGWLFYIKTMTNLSQFLNQFGHGSHAYLLDFANYCHGFFMFLWGLLIRRWMSTNRYVGLRYLSFSVVGDVRGQLLSIIWVIFGFGEKELVLRFLSVEVLIDESLLKAKAFADECLNNLLDVATDNFYN